MATVINTIEKKYDVVINQSARKITVVISPLGKQGLQGEKGDTGDTGEDLTEGAYLPLAGGTMDADAVITFNNGSTISEGTTDEGTGGAGGVEQTCSIGYKWKWEAGEIYIRDQSGNIARKENARTEPTNESDITKNYFANSYWEMFDGRLYKCTDATEANAVWELQQLSYTKNESDDLLSDKVDKESGLSLYSDTLADARAELRYTEEEKTKLAGLDGNKWRGKYLSEASLFAIIGYSGDSASVDEGEGFDLVAYIWDDNDNKWVKQLGVSTAETPASIKSKYESNADTNSLTDILKANFIAAYNWVTTNGTNVLNHLSSTLNPHSVTAAQVGAPSGSGTSTGTNTGDNATNSQYSGLASSKEDSSNKSTSTADSASSTKFPVWSAILSYFDASRIRTLLGITTLSGSNTGDQDLSGKLDVTGCLIIVSSATPVTLTASSPRFVIVTGSAAQTINLPVTSTLTVGYQFNIINTSTNTTTVNSSGGNVIGPTVANSISCNFYCILTTGTTAASWQQVFSGSPSRTGNAALVYASFPSLINPSYAVNANFSAGTNAQAQGVISTDVVVITSTPNNPSGVTLPAAPTASRHQTIINKGTNPVNVYPASGFSIDALSVNTPYLLPVNGIMVFRSTSATQWYSETVIPKLSFYANDAAADADSSLASGAFYKITGSRTVLQKP